MESDNFITSASELDSIMKNFSPSTNNFLEQITSDVDNNNILMYNKSNQFTFSQNIYEGT